MGKYWICICLAWGLGIGGCTPVQQYRYTEGKIYGTFYHISYASDEDLKEEILRQMESVNASLSMFNPESVIARLNRNETDSTDALFQKMYAMALQVNRKTEGAFDITVGPLVNAWGFGFKNGQDLTPAQIDSILSFVGFEKVALENGKIVKQDPRVILDCSAIAKGYGSDAVARLFDRKGIRNYMIEIGGEIVVKGLSPKEQKWKVGINKPIDDSLNVNNEIQTILNVTDLGIATSGNYRNFYYKDGKKYAHTIDPRTGYPVQHNILSATVIAEDCMTADALATAFMVMGLEEASAFANAHPAIDAYFIYSDENGKFQTFFTDGMKKYMPAK